MLRSHLETLETLLKMSWEQNEMSSFVELTNVLKVTQQLSHGHKLKLRLNQSAGHCLNFLQNASFDLTKDKTKNKRSLNSLKSSQLLNVVQPEITHINK